MKYTLNCLKILCPKLVISGIVLVMKGIEESISILPAIFLRTVSQNVLTRIFWSVCVLSLCIKVVILIQWKTIDQYRPYRFEQNIW